MNMNQLLNMITRMFIRKAVNKGINTGIKQVSKVRRAQPASAEPNEDVPARGNGPTKEQIRAQRRARRAAREARNK